MARVGLVWLFFKNKLSGSFILYMGIITYIFLFILRFSSSSREIRFHKN